MSELFMENYFDRTVHKVSILHSVVVNPHICLVTKAHENFSERLYDFDQCKMLLDSNMT
jgi:hypothetical protein